MEKIIQMMKNRRSLIIWESIAFVFALAPVAIKLSSASSGLPLFSESRIVSTLIYFSISLVLVGIGITLSVCQRKIKAKTDSMKCWEIDLSKHDESEILAVLENNLQLSRISEECFYGKHDYDDNWQVFVFSFKNNDHYNDLSKADQYIAEVSEMNGYSIEKQIRRKKLIARINVYIYDKIPETVLNSACESIENDVFRMKAILNVFISLDEGKLFIPVISPKENIEMSITPYLEDLKEIKKLFDL